MGTFNWPLSVVSADGENVETVDALVDTGASYSMFPSSMLEQLGIERRFALPFQQADGSIIERDVGQAVLVINDSESSMRVIFGEDDNEALLGANALQEFLLLIDPVGEQLVLQTGRLKIIGGG
jgi:predicted aspartyl protease